jgi:hypothetical protein
MRSDIAVLTPPGVEQAAAEFEGAPVELVQAD